MESLPKYKPDQWVIYMHADTPQFGKIFRGEYVKLDDEYTWRYYLTQTSESYDTAKEEEIVAVCDDKGWRRIGPAKSAEEAGVAW